MQTTTRADLRGSRAPTALVRRTGAMLALVVIAGLVLGEGLALAHSGHPAPSVPSPAIADMAKTPLLLAKRRRRKTRRRRRTTKVKRPRSDQQAFPEREGDSSPPAAPPAAAGGALRRGARVEFDGRLVQGQTAKSGAIYLFARKRSELRSMVKERSTYRKAILRTVYPNDEYEDEHR